MKYIAFDKKKYQMFLYRLSASVDPEGANLGESGL